MRLSRTMRLSLTLLGGAAALQRPYLIRAASWPEDYEAVCAVRAPSQYVSEAGTTGFMGQKVVLDADEAQRRRVQARLGSALRDEATVLLAEATDTPHQVIATLDCVPLPAGSRRATGPQLPARVLIRNLWVDPEERRRGIARELMLEVGLICASHTLSVSLSGFVC